jgi:acetyl esterase
MREAREDLYVDPDVALILEEAAAAGLPDMAILPVEQARAQVEATNAPWNHPVPELAVVEDLTVAGAGGPIRLRHFRPSLEPRLPAILYAHGGGFVVCSLDTHDRLMRLLAQRTGAAVIGVDYRLAPEHPYPAALGDCLAAHRWLHAHGRKAGLDPGRVVVAGDSAGANLALAALLALRDGKGPLPKGGALFYGCYWSRLDTPSHARFGDGAWHLSTGQMAWFWRHYLGRTPAGDPLAEPLYADLARLPPLFLNVGTLDPLADDTHELARSLERAGVPFDLKVHPGLVHAFMRMTVRCAAADAAMDDAAAAIRSMLAQA